MLTDPTFDPPGHKYSFGLGISSLKLIGPAIPAIITGVVMLVVAPTEPSKYIDIPNAAIGTIIKFAAIIFGVWLSTLEFSAGTMQRTLAGFAAMQELGVWYARLDVEEFEQRRRSQVSMTARRRLDKNLAKARNKDSLRALERLTERRDGELRIASRPPLLVPIEELAKREGADPVAITALMRRLLGEYRETLDEGAQVLTGRYRYVVAAHKVVGVGSVGTRAWITLLLGRDEADPLFLQIKEAGPSVLEPFAGASRFGHHGERVVSGQRLTQAAGDVLLGWLSAEGLDGKKRDFYVRQLWDGKGSADIDAMEATTMIGYARLCGWTLARAHARTGDRRAIDAYLGKGDRFDRAIAEFSQAYADQNEADYTLLIEAERSGDLKVESGL